MRVTGMMQNTQFLKNLRNTNMGLVDLQNKLATGERIHRPGDDPVGIGYLMRYDTELDRSKEFLENARTGKGWLNQMDDLMQQANKVLQRTRVLVQQAATDTTPDDARQHIKAEIEQLKEQMVAIGNSTYNGRFIFNGQKSDLPPYTNDGAAYEQTDKGLYYLNVSSSVTVPVSITGEDIFGTAGKPAAGGQPAVPSDNVFQIFDEIINNLSNNDIIALSSDMEKIDGAADRILTNSAEIGARTNRFSLIEERILDEQLSLEELRAQVGGADMPGTFIELQLKQNILQASLATGSQIMRVSLVDYIR
ncbi:flagellar hook-associated protein FlgL [Paenibacillus yanchengensis]|uniref:Flagellar hook-associated protein FlgL n=1 Tax=Paenibacillus yanchengensis TaxID=2035833 RepID=A0ABW4YMX4_9BACL